MKLMPSSLQCHGGKGKDKGQSLSFPDLIGQVQRFPVGRGNLRTEWRV